MSRSFLTQTRLVLVGREHLLREVAFDEIGARPRVAGFALRVLGPVGNRSLPTLTMEAEHYARRQGHHADCFVIAGVGDASLVALVPEQPAAAVADADRLLKALGVLPPRQWASA